MSPEDISRIRDGVIDDIIIAFECVSRENGVSLHEAQVIDEYGTETEKEEARRLDTEGRWQDVPDKDIERHNSILCFVDLIGWRYYLAAYMVWVLRNYLASDSFSKDSTIYSLRIDKNSDLEEHFQQRFDILSQEQSRSVCRFLRFMREYAEGRCDSNAADEAIQFHWGQFCK